MALLISTEGQLELLDKMLKDALSSDENYILKLYRNDYTPVLGSTSAAFTEANFGNYSAKTLTRANWAAATTNGSVAQTTYATQAWTVATTGNTIYGYWIEAGTSGKVLWAERFGTSRVLADTDVLNVTPLVTLS